MGLYLEESSTIDSSSSVLIEPAPSAEQIGAAGKPPRHGRRGTGKFFRQGTARPEDAIPPGTCARCGRIADHATSEDCIEQLRDEIADLTNAELRVGKPRRRGRK